MSDVNCPYCGHSQEINHDDGYGYEDGGEFEQYCVSCDKEFKFTTSTMYCYEVMCKDGDHDIETRRSKRHPGLVFTSCTKCDWTGREDRRI